MKEKSLTYSVLLLAGLLISVAQAKLWFLISCLGLIPLFAIQNNHSKKEIALGGLFFGFGLGLGLFYWMIEGLINYTGNSILFGFFITILSALCIGSYFALLNWIISFIWIKHSVSKLKLINNRICISAVWAVAEFCLSNALEAFPLHNIRIGFSLVSNLFLVQLTSFGGVMILTFLTVLINILLTEFYLTKKNKFIFISLTLLLGMYSIGALIYCFYNPYKTGKSFKIALVSDNTSAEAKWDTNNGNTLAATYFQLCKQATDLHPDFIIWPETALPWAYAKDDDLLNEIIQISRNQQLIHVIGINNENYTTKKLYNSVFYLNNTNQIKGTYNKQILLKGIEQPIGNLIVPFLSQDGFVLTNGKDQKPINTPFGKAGNLICNEVVSENCSNAQVKKGANFFFNLSNDGWFRDCYVSDLHFYYARLQAVLTRKDICISNNCGTNGIISSDGTIVSESKDLKSTCIAGYIQPNSNVSFYTKYPYLFLLFFSLIICINLIINYKQLRNQF